MIPQKTALIAGASGLVGSHCLQLLLQSSRYGKVIALTRKALPVYHPKLEQKVIDYEKLSALAPSFIADDVFCCLGTTMKAAGSKENFYKVDYTYVIELAKVTVKNFATQFLLVSAMGADKDSLFFYNKVKGQAEETVKNLPFTAVHIFRPSLLLGDRTEPRMGEKIGGTLFRIFNFALIGPLKKYRPVNARTVAKAMLQMAIDSGGGIKIHLSDEIARYESVPAE